MLIFASFSFTFSLRDPPAERLHLAAKTEKEDKEEEVEVVEETFKIRRALLTHEATLILWILTSLSCSTDFVLKNVTLLI